MTLSTLSLWTLGLVVLMATFGSASPFITDISTEANMTSTCKNGQVWTDTGMVCNRTCDNPEPFCISRILPGCQCPDSAPILLNNKCTTLDKCPSKNLCPGGMVFNSCGSRCTPTCDNRHPICPAVCVARCECPPGKRILKDNQCVSELAC